MSERGAIKDGLPTAGGAGGGSCPEPEFVSCYFDRELALDTPEARHITDCQRCGRTLASYAEIGCGWRQEMAVATPVDLAERVSRHVRRQGCRPMVVPWWHWPLRVAAVLTVGAIALCVWRARDLLDDLSAVEVVAVPVEVSPAAAAMMPPADPAVVDAPYVAPGQVAAADYSPAGLGASPFHFSGAVADLERSERPTAIGATVRHVWLSQDPAGCCTGFAQAADAAGVTPAEIKMTDGDEPGNRQLEVTASRRQLVGLVRSWADSGHRLVSPVPPQPEQTVFAGTGDEPVRYIAVFVPAMNHEVDGR